MLDVVVQPGGRLTAGRLHRSLRPAARDGVQLLDLRAASWIEPIGLVMLAALAEETVRQGGAVILRGPVTPGLTRYAARMRLGRIMNGLGQEHDLPAVREWERGSELLETLRFSGEAEPDRLAAMVFAKTEADLRVARALHQSIAELGVNVPQHSGLDHGYVASQSTYDGQVVQFAVGDAGRGVAAGFGDAVPDADAVDKALTGVSRIPDRGRGRGLAKTQRLVLALGGSFHVVSGTAHRTREQHGDTSGSAAVGYPGTLLQGTFPVPDPADGSDDGALAEG